MDNLCHTLVGAAIGRAGFRTRTSLASATLMIAANIPDLDVLVFATDEPSISFRRGWTHGVVAQALLPLALAAVMTAFGRWRGDRPGKPALRPGWLLGLSYLGLFSHVFLDFLNTYGVRLLAPVDWRWYYGDAVFILDPWLWLMLGAGVWWSRRLAAVTPARVALTMAVLYIGLMLGSTYGARRAVTDAWEASRGESPRALMVGPVPVNPAVKQVIVDAGDHYETGTFDWWTRRAEFDPQQVPKNDRAPEVRAARAEPGVAAFLVWSRFPFYEVAPEPQGTRVSVSDLRMANAGSLRALVRSRFVQSVVIPHHAD